MLRVVCYLTGTGTATADAADAADAATAGAGALAAFPELALTAGCAG